MFMTLALDLSKTKMKAIKERMNEADYIKS